MKQTQTDLLQGTLDLLVLKTLQSGPTHGWDIAQRMRPETIVGRDQDLETIHRCGRTNSENVLNGRV